MIQRFSMIMCGLLFGWSVAAQFHTLKLPKASPEVKEMQQLGITEVAIHYHSPAVKGRQIWGSVVPMNGSPIPWRVGANMNTRISFSTEVKINGNNLAAGSYGLHAIPKEDDWTLIFASNDNLWGSYYLDMEKDVALEIEVTPMDSEFSEQLDFEFRNRTDSSMTVAIEWEKLSIPFQIEVDLKSTVLASLRYELRGINTYHWQAWNDAARWCLDNNINLEEALVWVNRSIEGGYGGFAAQKTFGNLRTKADLLWKMGQQDESKRIYEEAIELLNDPGDAYESGTSLFRSGRKDLSAQLLRQASKKFDDAWYVHMAYGKVLYWTGNSRPATKAMNLALESTPDQTKVYIRGLIDNIKKGEEIR